MITVTNFLLVLEPGNFPLFSLTWGGNSSKGQGVNNPKDGGPKARHDCVELDADEEQTKGAMDCCKEKKTQLFCPGITDCHNWVKRCLKKNGIDDETIWGRFK